MRLILLAAFLALPCLCQKDQTCPWINAATAAGILGGAVNATLAHPPACEFERQKPPLYTLRIKVGPRVANTEKCPSNPTRLKAVGNDAIACAEQGKDGQQIESIIGRVRDQDFVIRITTNDSSATPASLLEKARIAAEQVVGNLF